MGDSVTADVSSLLATCSQISAPASSTAESSGGNRISSGIAGSLSPIQVEEKGRNAVNAFVDAEYGHSSSNEIVTLKTSALCAAVENMVLQSAIYLPDNEHSLTALRLLR